MLIESYNELESEQQCTCYFTMKVFVVKLIAILVLLAMATSSIIDVKPCKNVPDGNCVLTTIGAGPCFRNTAHNCTDPDDVDERMSFEFIPQFNATRLTSRVNRYLAGGSAQDWMFDACNDTACPVKSGRQQTYFSAKKYVEKLPAGNYTYKWELFDPTDYHNLCCIQIVVNIGMKIIMPVNRSTIPYESTEVLN